MRGTLEEDRRRVRSARLVDRLILLYKVDWSLQTRSVRTVGSIRGHGGDDADFPIAIATLLQPAIVRSGLLPHTSAPLSASHRPPSAREIPPVTLTNIPHVDSSVFKPYLSQVGSLFDARLRSERDAEQAQKRDKRPKKDEDPGYFDNKGYAESPTRRPSLGPASPDSPVLGRRLSGTARRSQLTVAPLSSIPNVYFEDNFRLENPRTFDVVTEKSEVIRTPHDESKVGNGAPLAPRKALATNAILQEKLSWYLDTVEIHLISSISSASKSFFAALGSLKELHSDASDSVSKIQTLRGNLERLDKEMAQGRLEIVRLKQRQQNLRKLACAAQQLHNVIKGATHCEELVDQGQLELALDRISILENYTCGNLDETLESQDWLFLESLENLIDLRKLKALGDFDRGMNQLRESIGIGFQASFTEVLLSDLKRHIASVHPNDTLQRWANASRRSRGMHVSTGSISLTYMESYVGLREKLTSILNGLKRSKSTSMATSAFRELVNKEVKSIIRHNLPSSSDDDVESVNSTSTRSSRAALSQREKSAILARNLRALTPDDAEELLTKTYCAIGETLRRLQFQCKLLLDVSSDPSLLSPTKSAPRSLSFSSLNVIHEKSGRTPSPNFEQELLEALDLSSVLGQAVDVAQTQIIKVLNVRAEQSSRLALSEFLRYFTLNRLFTDECEAVSGRSGASLKSVVNNHIKDFIVTWAESERQSLATAMEADRWDPQDFAMSDKIALSQVLEGMTADSAAYLQQSYLWETNPANGTNSTNGTQEMSRSAVIEEDKFILAPSPVLLLHGITRFETLIANIPSIASEVSTALIDYLKFFNSKSCQFILGAGAIRSSAKLKFINTKHLALASQALSFVITLIPYIRECVRRRPGVTGVALGEYDKVRALYHDHQTNIHEKLVDIMSTRATNHVNAMRAIDWDVEPNGPSTYMEILTKDTVSLQKTLGKYMPTLTVKSIVEQVFASYRDQWGRAFREVKPRTEVGKQRSVIFINLSIKVCSQMLDSCRTQSTSRRGWVAWMGREI